MRVVGVINEFDLNTKKIFCTIVGVQFGYSNRFWHIFDMHVVQKAWLFNSGVASSRSFSKSSYNSFHFSFDKKTDSVNQWSINSCLCWNRTHNLWPDTHFWDRTIYAPIICMPWSTINKSLHMRMENFICALDGIRK